MTKAALHLIDEITMDGTSRIAFNSSEANFDTVLDAVSKFKGDPQIEFHFLGIEFHFLGIIMSTVPRSNSPAADIWARKPATLDLILDCLADACKVGHPGGSTLREEVAIRAVSPLTEFLIKKATPKLGSAKRQKALEAVDLARKKHKRSCKGQQYKDICEALDGTGKLGRENAGIVPRRSSVGAKSQTPSESGSGRKRRRSSGSGDE